MAASCSSTISDLVNEIRESNKIRHTLVRCVDVCRRRIENEKHLRANAIENLKKMLIDYDDSEIPAVALDDGALDELVAEDPIFGNMVKECTNKEEADKLIQEIEIKLQRCCLIQYEVMAKFFPNEFESLTDDEKLADSLQTAVDFNPLDELGVESWADEWIKKFRPFSIVDESGDLLPTPNDIVENEQMKESVPTVGRYMTLTVSDDRAEIIPIAGDQPSGYEMMTLSPLSGVCEHIYENILSDASSVSSNTSSTSNTIYEEIVKS